MRSSWLFVLVAGFGWFGSGAAGLGLRFAIAQEAIVERPLPTHRIALVRDRDSPYFDEVIAGFRAELEALSADQYQFELRDTYNAEGDPARVAGVLRSALQDPDVSVVYTAGFVSTFAASSLDEADRTKPVVGGAVEFIDVNGEQIAADGGSKIPNYTFIQSPRRVEADLEKLAQLSGADAIYAIVDRFAFDSLQGIFRPQIDALAAKLGVHLEAIPRGDTPAASVAGLPAGAKAAYVPVLSGVDDAFRRELFEELRRKNILSIGILGARDAEIGAFAGLASDNTAALHRRIAINLHQILSGVPTQLLPVLLRADDQLVINMETAAAVGWSPDYETSLAARFLFRDVAAADTPELSLEEAMELAETGHPDVASAGARARAEEFSTDVARGSYRPQLDFFGEAGVAGATERAGPVLDPAHAHSLALGLELRQLLFSDRVGSQVRAQTLVADAARLEEDSVRLDVIEASGAAFLDVLTAEALYEVEKENLQLIENNLQLAKLRRDIGAGEPVEIFRWEASRAQAHSNLFRRDSERKTARIRLNVALGVERTRSWRLRDIRLADDDFYFMDEALSGLVTNLAVFRRFIEFLRSDARERSPEIAAFEKNLSAQGVLLDERSRRNFVPEVSGIAGFQRTLQGAHRIRSDSQNEWSVGFGFVFPLFDGRRSAERGRIRSVRSQLSSQRDQALFLIEQRALAAGYGIGASHPAMLFSRRALEAANANFDAVQSKYQQGAATILDLLDAQQERLAQRQNEALAGYRYLRDVLAMQRAIAWFEYSKSADERTAWVERLRSFLETDAS